MTNRDKRFQSYSDNARLKMILETRIHNHVCTYRQIGNEIEEIFMTNADGSWCPYSTRYWFRKGLLVVTGDVADAVYQWYGDVKSIWWIAGCDSSYFASKCLASPVGRSFMDWDENKAYDALLEHLKHHESEWFKNARYHPIYYTGDDQNIPPRERVEILRDAIESARDSKFEWLRFLDRSGNELFGSDFYELCDIGEITSLDCLFHLAGLKLAAKQLNEETPA